MKRVSINEKEEHEKDKEGNKRDGHLEGKMHKVCLGNTG